MKANQSILKLLHDSGHLSDSNVKTIKKFADSWETPEYQAILETHIMTEPQLADTIAEIFKLNRVFAVSTLDIKTEALKNIGFQQAKKFECIPIGPSEDRDGMYEVVVSDPTTSSDLISELEKEVGSEIVLAVGERSDILCVIDTVFPISQQLPGLYEE